MDELRKEIRKPKGTRRELCKVIEKEVVDRALDARATARAGAADVARIRGAVRAQIGCRGREGARTASLASPAEAGAFTFATSSLGASQEFTLSADASALVDQVMAAADGATSADEVASELAGISAQAQGLSADEASIIDALTSVSLSSFEYWSQQGDAMAAEFASAYGDCIEGGGGEGCYLATSREFAPRRAPTTMFLAAYGGQAAACTIDKGTIWRGDKWGAGVGLTLGLSGGGVIGGIIGIIAGAAAGSAGAATYEFGRYLGCVF